jgi:hypothetical protein
MIGDPQLAALCDKRTAMPQRRTLSHRVDRTILGAFDQDQFATNHIELRFLSSGQFAPLCSISIPGQQLRFVAMRKLSDIVSNQDALTLPANATVKEACRCMRDRRVGAVLVTEGDRRLVGIFTGRMPSIACWRKERARPRPRWPMS